MTDELTMQPMTNDDSSDNLCPVKRKATSQGSRDSPEKTDFTGIGHVLLYRQARVYVIMEAAHAPIEDGEEVDLSSINPKIVELVNNTYQNSTNIVLEIKHTQLSNDKCQVEVTFIGIDNKITAQLNQTSMTKFIFYIGLQEITKDNNRTELSVFNGHPTHDMIAFYNEEGRRLPYKTRVIDITELNLK